MVVENGNEKIMRNFLAATLLAVLVAACTQQSAPEFAIYNGESIQIEVTSTPGLIDAEYVLKINGEPVIKQRSQAFGGSLQVFDGSWRGKKVSARTTRVQNMFSTYTQVDVFIDGQLVETLTV